MADLAEWLAAQLDTDERIAKAAERRSGGAAAPPHVDEAGRWYPAGLQSLYDVRVDEHIATHDPIHVLRTIAAHRAILSACVTSIEEADRRLATGDRSDLSAGLLASHVQRMLAPIYEHRKGFDPAWKVEP